MDKLRTLDSIATEWWGAALCSFALRSCDWTRFVLRASGVLRGGRRGQVPGDARADASGVAVFRCKGRAFEPRSVRRPGLRPRQQLRDRRGQPRRSSALATRGRSLLQVERHHLGACGCGLRASKCGVAARIHLVVRAGAAKLERDLQAWHVAHHPQDERGRGAVALCGRLGLRWCPLARAAQALQALRRPALCRA